MKGLNKKFSIIFLAVLMMMNNGFISIAAESNVKKPVVQMNKCNSLYFGNYYQTDTNGDGVADTNDEMTPIRWRILWKEGDMAYVIADQVLDCKKFNETKETVTWENSSIREWLNDDFYEIAFSETEQSAIISDNIINDNIFLLSIDDVRNTDYGFDSKISTMDEARIATATEYAKEHGALDSYYEDKNYMYCDWWLRSLGDTLINGKCGATIVWDDGTIDKHGSNVDGSYTRGVRPAMYLNFASECIETGEDIGVSIKDVSWDVIEIGVWDEKPIKWRVLDVSGNDVYLLSDLIIKKDLFNEQMKAITWKDSTVRSWLNNEFYETVFNEKEKNAILEYTYNNIDNPWYGVDAGDDTSDYVCLLSWDEITNEEYGFPSYPIKKHTSRYSYTQDGELYAWWLRTPGSNNGLMSVVSVSGRITENTPWDNSYGIRPALHVDINSLDIEMVGTISTKIDIQQQDKESAAIIDEMISAIGDVTLESKDEIGAARNAYEALSEGAKLLVTKLSVLEEAEIKLSEIEKQVKYENDKAEKEKQEINAASEVDKLITAIGTVSADSKTAIDIARKAYNALSDGAKIKVTELAALEAAEAKLAEIEKNANNGSVNNENDDNKKNDNVDNNFAISSQQTTTEQAVIEQKVAMPSKVKITSVKNNKLKSFVVIWKKNNGVKRYEVQYAINKKFTKSKKSKITTKLTITVKKLKKGKTYYVRVRAYNTDSKGTKVYGKWSAVKKVKIKK